MAYNRENYLKNVLRVQEIVLHYRKQDLFFNEIFHKYVEKQFNISKRTYDSYLGLNARKQLKELQEIKGNKTKDNNNSQLNLF